MKPRNVAIWLAVFGFAVAGRTFAQTNAYVGPLVIAVEPVAKTNVWEEHNHSLSRSYVIVTNTTPMIPTWEGWVEYGYLREYQASDGGQLVVRHEYVVTNRVWEVVDQRRDIEMAHRTTGEPFIRHMLEGRVDPAVTVRWCRTEILPYGSGIRFWSERCAP